jgi:choline dehydrogenase
VVDSFDFVIVGGGSAGAALAARLSEDPSITVVLIEAGGRPPAREAMPAACISLQLDPETDWMFSGDPGKGGRGFNNQRMPVPRGKMLGGSSGINYMVWVHGHPGDFDNWERLGATGWSHEDVLPCFKRLEAVAQTNEASIDREQRGDSGPVGVGIRSPVIPAARAFVEAAIAAGIPEGDYNGSGRFNAAGVASLVQTNTSKGRRSSTFHAYLENKAELRPNLTIITGALVTTLNLEGEGATLAATGVCYRDAAGDLHVAHADREIVLSAGAVGSPHVLMLSGIGSRRELEAAGVVCRLDQPHVGKHLKDHLYTPLMFEAPGLGVAVNEIALSIGPDALRAPGGPLPVHPHDDRTLTNEQLSLKAEAERRIGEWLETGSSLAASSFYDAVCFFSTGLGTPHTHDAQIGFLPMANTADSLSRAINYDLNQLIGDSVCALDTDREGISVLASNCVPRSEGEIVLTSADPAVPPEINFNYFGDPYDLKVMVAIIRRTLDVMAHWPGPVKPGRWLVPPGLAKLHGYRDGEVPSDALLESMALHFGTTIYHLSCTCRIGSVVDPQLRVMGVQNLRVADASIMPEITSGNLNAPSIMIGERAADIIRAAHRLRAAA